MRLPDSTFVVARRLLESATQSILIGMYDFTASYIADLLLAAVGRGVTVTMMIDLALSTVAQDLASRPDAPAQLFNATRHLESTSMPT